MFTGSGGEGFSKTNPFKSYIRQSSPRIQFERFGPRSLSIARNEVTEAASTNPVTAAKTAIATELKPELNDFQSLVTGYGRAIIKSAMDHEPEDSDMLKQDIMAAKEKIIVKHQTIENKLETAEAEIRVLRSSVFDLRLEKATSGITQRLDGCRIERLERQLKDQAEEYMKCMDLLTEETATRKVLEVESAKWERDKKRKRESVAAIWEDAESVKLE